MVISGSIRESSSFPEPGQRNAKLSAPKECRSNAIPLGLPSKTLPKLRERFLYKKTAHGAD